MRILKGLGAALCALTALALIAMATPARAQAPHYLDALSDLRTARDYIKSDHRPEYDGQRHHALDEINKAIDEIKQAAWDDGKNTKWAPPASPVTDPWQPERMAANWLAEALKQLSTSEEQQSANHALQQRAIQHVAEAHLAVGGLIRMSGH